MFAQLQLMPEQASTVAGEVDSLFCFVLAVCVFFTLLIAGMIVYFAIKYRRRNQAEVPPPIEGSLKLEIVWTLIPLGIGLIMFVWGSKVFINLSRPPDDSLQIYVVAKQWMWKLQHPDGQREIDTLHIPVGQPIKLVMISEDVIHSFYVPAFRTKQDVLPGRYSTTWFQATKPGRYHFFCAEYCGTNHSLMRGTIIAMDPADYEHWLIHGAEGSDALEGEKLFRQLKCISCHSTDTHQYAPALDDLYGKTVRLNDGRTVLANEAYLRESILDPDARIVSGYQPVMPTYAGQVNETEISQLIAFIRSLKNRKPPTRVEDTPPPFQRK